MFLKSFHIFSVTFVIAADGQAPGTYFLFDSAVKSFIQPFFFFFFHGIRKTPNDVIQHKIFLALWLHPFMIYSDRYFLDVLFSLDIIT